MQGRGHFGDHLDAYEDGQDEDRQPDNGFSVQLLAPLAADPALESAYFVVARRRRSMSAHSSSARRRAIRDSIAPSARCGSRFGARLLRRRSQTKSESAHSSSARRRAIRDSIAHSARCGSRFGVRLLRRRSQTKSESAHSLPPAWLPLYTCPSWVRHIAETISSSKSGANRPSRVINMITFSRFWA